MKATSITLAVAFLLTLVASSNAQQQLIPPPGPSQGGFFMQLSDDTIVDASAIATSPPAAYRSAAVSPVSVSMPIAPQPSTAPWQPAPQFESGVQPAGCNDCGQLWANACNDGTTGGSIFTGGGVASSGISTGCDTGGCDTGGCDSIGGSCAGICGDKGGCAGGCGMWSHFTSAYASALYLRPRNADIAYAVPIDGPIVQAPANNPIQVGGVGVVDPEYDLAFSAGLNLAINSMTSLVAEVMILDSSSFDRIATTAPNVLRSIVSHPSSASIATDFLSGSSNLGIDLETFDLGIRHLFVGGQVFAVNYHVGARYGRLEQMFDANFVANGTETVRTDVDFDGIGPRLGLEAERQSCHSRFRIYSKASASFLAGRFRANYFQGNSFDPTVVDTNWEAGRVVPVLDIELGGGWSSPGGRLRVSGGYLVSSWFNSVKTEDFIRSVQSNDFVDLHDTITFDGLRFQAEVRF